MARSVEFEVIANDKATGTLKGVKGAISELSDRMAKMFALTTLFDKGFGMAQQAVSYFFATLRNTADIKNLSKSAGITTEEFQKMALVAENAGLSQDGLLKGMRYMREAIRDARVEGSNQQKALLALGYTQEQVTAGNVDAMDAMSRLSGAVQAASTSQEKYNIVAGIFGWRAQELIPMIDELRNAMQQVSQQPIFTDEQINNVERLEKRIDKFQQRAKVALVTYFDFWSQLGEKTPYLPNIYAGLKSFDQAAMEAVPVTEKDKAAATALGKLGITSSAAGGSSSGMAGISSAQSLGMATSIALAQQQTSYLATIAANTSPSMGGALPGGTNMTRPDATQSEVDTLARNIRFSKSVPIFPHQRPAR